ncbi:MAG TPA: hypothetical protein PLQ36_03105 [Candidatus Gracilibacteria bacterium]|nr:hypothetical protein [Candidatus Gracilibacteria bacterium]
MNLRKIFFSLFLGFSLFTSLVPVQAAGSMLPDDWYYEEVKDAVPLPVSKKQGGLEQLQDLLINNLGQILRYILISVGILYATTNILLMVFSSDDTSKLGKMRESLGYLVLGLIVVSMSSEIALIFDFSKNKGDLADMEQINSVSQTFINYLSLIVGSIVSLFLVLSGVKMITAQGDSKVIEEQQKNLKYGFLGLVVIIMADVLVNKIFYPKAEVNVVAPGAEQMSNLTKEVFGIISYVMEFLGIGAIVAIIGAGAYYIFSFTNPDKMDTAKNILKNVSILFIIIALAYTIVSAIIPQ